MKNYKYTRRKCRDGFDGTYISNIYICLLDKPNYAGIYYGYKCDKFARARTLSEHTTQ